MGINDVSPGRWLTLTRTGALVYTADQYIKNTISNGYEMMGDLQRSRGGFITKTLQGIGSRLGKVALPSQKGYIVSC